MQKTTWQLPKVTPEDNIFKQPSMLKRLCTSHLKDNVRRLPEVRTLPFNLKVSLGESSIPCN